LNAGHTIFTYYKSAPSFYFLDRYLRFENFLLLKDWRFFFRKRQLLLIWLAQSRETLRSGFFSEATTVFDLVGSKSGDFAQRFGSKSGDFAQRTQSREPLRSGCYRQSLRSSRAVAGETLRSG